MLKRKDSNLQRHTAAALPETKYLLLLTYIRCKRFFISPPCLPFHHASMFFKELFLRRRKDSNFHGLIHGQFITPDRSTLLCLPLHHGLHSSEHLVGFEPTIVWFCRPLPLTTRPQVHFNQFGQDSNLCFLASRL